MHQIRNVSGEPLWNIRLNQSKLRQKSHQIKSLEFNCFKRRNAHALNSRMWNVRFKTGQAVALAGKMAVFLQTREDCGHVVGNRNSRVSSFIANIIHLSSGDEEEWWRECLLFHHCLLKISIIPVKKKKKTSFGVRKWYFRRKFRYSPNTKPIVPLFQRKNVRFFLFHFSFSCLEREQSQTYLSRSWKDNVADLPLCVL